MVPRYSSCSLLSFLLLCLSACSALAEVRVNVVETDPPGEIVTLGRDEAFYVRIAYIADEPVRIWARPYLDGKEVVLRGTRSNPSITHTGEGYALGWFSFQEPARADEVRITIGRAHTHEATEAARYPLRLTATGEPPAARTRASWVAELQRETDAKARRERETQSADQGTPRERALTYGFFLLIGAVVLGVPLLLLWIVWKAARGELRVQRGESLPYAVSALCGLAVCLGISLATGRKEAWDSSLYFSVGLPLMAFAIFVLSYLYPRRAWRWTLSMAIGQSVAMLLGGNSLSLWPLAILAMLFFSLPQFAAGFAGSWLARRAA